MLWNVLPIFQFLHSLIQFIQLINFFQDYNSLIIQYMQTVKPSQYLKYQHYELQIDVHNQRSLTLTVLDRSSRIQYIGRDIRLQDIGTNTLIKALQKSIQQIKIEFAEKSIADMAHLQIKVSVQFPFLKPVHQIIMLNKNREVNEMQIIKKSMEYLNRKIKDINSSNDQNSTVTYYGGRIESKNYCQAGYEKIATIKLSKGQYLLTFNFLLQATNSWFYLYLNEGEVLFPNSGFYQPNNNSFIPHTVRKVYKVVNEYENISFTTCSASVYPGIIRDAIITAKKLHE